MARKNRKKPRVDVSGDGPPVPDDRFAVLASLKEDSALPSCGAGGGDTGTPQPRSSLCAGSGEEGGTAGDAGWTIERSRKGGFRISLERRRGNRVVTVLLGVKGNGRLLAGLLRKRCASGGAFTGDRIELQGDHTGSLAEILEELLAR